MRNEWVPERNKTYHLKRGAVVLARIWQTRDKTWKSAIMVPVDCPPRRSEFVDRLEAMESVSRYVDLWFMAMTSKDMAT